MPDSPALRLPPDATPDEAAAIAAAVGELLATEARAGRDGPSGEDRWAGRRFGFAGRLAKVTGEGARPPPGAPADPWTAAGRARRF